MSRPERRKAKRRRRRTGQPTDGLPTNGLHRAESHQDRQDDPLGAVASAPCPECGEPVRWTTAAELAELDPELVGLLEEVLGPDLLVQADLWTCPACGSAGVSTDGEPYDPDEIDADGPNADDPDEPTALDDLLCRACGSPLEWLDPARIASIDRTAYLQARIQFGADALLDGDASACWTCGAITFHPAEGP